MKKVIKGEDCAKATRGREGWTIKNGKGSHVKITAPCGDAMIVYNGELSIGVGCKVRKWFLRFGIILTIIGAIAYYA